MACFENQGYIVEDPLTASKFKWTVPNFFALHKNSVELFVSSPWFSFWKHKWRLVLFPTSHSTQHKLISLFLFNKCSKYQIDEFRFTVELDGAYATTYHERKHPPLCETRILKSGGKFECKDFISVRSVANYNEVISNGIMSFVCEITKLHSSEKTEAGGNKEIKDDNQECTGDDEDEEWSDVVDGEYSDDSEDSGDISMLCDSRAKETKSLNAKGLDRLLENLEKMFIDGENSDVTLKIENEEIPVHKSILSVRSPVFASMLQLDMKEKKSSVVDIPDCSSGAFKVFLLYLYTGKTDTISAENVFGVYYAADKYQVDYLKEYCTQFMKNILSVDTFCDIIALSLHHCESDLQKAATRFFCKNIKKIIKTARWQTYLQNNPIQANELYIKALKA